MNTEIEESEGKIGSNHHQLTLAKVDTFTCAKGELKSIGNQGVYHAYGSTTYNKLCYNAEIHFNELLADVYP